MDSLALFMKSNYDFLFKKHEVSEEEFMTTYHYYENHPGKMDELMTKVVEELSKKDALFKGEEVSEDEINP